MPLFARRRWPRVDGVVIDKRHIRKFRARFDSLAVYVSVDEYMVEYAAAGGELRRLTIRAKSVHLPVRGIHIGQTVPLHVNRRGTRAVFGPFERGPSWTERRRRERERRARDEQRFRDKLGGA